MNKTDAITTALREAQTLLARGEIAQARSRCEAILREHPSHAGAHNFFAIVEYRRGDLDHALSLVDRALSLEPRNPDFLNSRGIILQSLGRLDDALGSFDEVLSIAPRAAQVLYNRGIALYAAGRLPEALASYQTAIELQPHYPEALINQGNVLQAQKRFDEALERYNRAIVQDSHLANAFVNRGIALQALNRPAEALADYDKALALQPNYPDALQNRGVALESLRRADEALAAYDRILELDPRHRGAVLKRGDTLQDLGRLDEAIASYRSALPLPVSHREEAMLHDRAAVELWWCERKLCAWDDLAHSTARALRSLRGGIATPNPFIALCISDDPEVQLACARRFATDLRRGSIEPLAKTVTNADRIRIGYMSGDLRDHATAYLLAGVLEQHDRARFEISAYSYGPDDGSSMRARLVRAVDAFIDVRDLDDSELAARIADDGVHILVDLDGYTRRSRASVWQFRPAPICVHYLGYPGSTGSSDVDYLIADSCVIRPEDERFFSEAIVRLPGSYQANDDKREIANLGLTRHEVGLPDDAFVYCAFNRPYKITPEVFDVWMRILREVPGSVLWLLRDSERIESNLRYEATLRGVDAQRLLFAPRVAHSEHLARQRLADLFLDTWPVCAHTTASDALWAGLPLVTYPGRTFISRVSASLLDAIGLPELVVSSAADYEKLAVSLACNPAQLTAVRDKLARNRSDQPLFDTRRFCRNLEHAFETMWAIAQRGESPRGFTVEETSSSDGSGRGQR